MQNKVLQTMVFMHCKIISNKNVNASYFPSCQKKITLRLKKIRKSEESLKIAWNYSQVFSPTWKMKIFSILEEQEILKTRYWSFPMTIF